MKTLIALLCSAALSTVALADQPGQPWLENGEDRSTVHDRASDLTYDREPISPTERQAKRILMKEQLKNVTPTSPATGLYGYQSCAYVQNGKVEYGTHCWDFNQVD